MLIAGPEKKLPLVFGRVAEVGEAGGEVVGDIGLEKLMDLWLSPRSNSGSFGRLLIL